MVHMFVFLVVVVATETSGVQEELTDILAYCDTSLVESMTKN